MDKMAAFEEDWTNEQRWGGDEGLFAARHVPAACWAWQRAWQAREPEIIALQDEIARLTALLAEQAA